MKSAVLKKKLSDFLPPVFILIFGIGLSLTFFFSIRHLEQKNLRDAFGRIATNRTLALQREIQDIFDMLDSVRYFFESSQLVERQEFTKFTSSFWNDSKGLQAITWAPCVKDSERERFEASVKPNDSLVFSIKERNEEGEFVAAQKRDEYFPVYYVEPFAMNKTAWGYDLASETARQEALADARDHNTTAITEGLQLVLGSQEIISFLIFKPLFQKNASIETVQDRQQHLEGFVIGVFRVQDLVEYVMSLTDIRSVSIYLCDLSAPLERRSLAYYTQGACDLGKLPDGLANGMLPSGLYSKKTFETGTRTWSIVCTPEPEMVAMYTTWNSWTTFSIGLLLTGFVFFYYQTMRRRTEAIENLVQIRTAELNRELDQRKRAEAELSQLTKSLKVKNAELESVVYIASHDLRSPLVNINGFSQELQNSCDTIPMLLKGEPISEKTVDSIEKLLNTDIPESLNFIHAGVEKMQMLTNGLLQISRVGTTAFDIQVIDMNRLFENIVETNAYQAKKKGVVITLDPVPSCRADMAKTNQVFSNLFSNALKYLVPDRPGKIHITGWQKEGRSVYCVEDNGIGIPESDHKKIFQMFQRAAAGYTVEGEGLGLAIVLRVLDCQNGEIWLESEVGKGSKFFVSLPTA